MSNTRTNHVPDEMENVNNWLETGASASTVEPELSPMLTAENGDGPVNHRYQPELLFFLWHQS